MERAPRNGKTIEKPIVLIISAQTTATLQGLDAEVTNVSEALLKVGICEAHTLLGADVERIFAKLQDFGKRIIAVHYAGHASGSGLLIQRAPGAGGGDQLAHSGGLAGMLKPLRNLKLVFLNGCETEEQVSHFLAVGIPAVIATTEKIGDRVATDFASKFYSSLASEHDIASAFELAESFVKTGTGEDCRGAYSEATELSPEEVNQWPWELHGDGMGWRLVDAADAGADAALAGEGLTAFKSLLDDPTVRAKVNVIRSEITETRDQLRIISGYKELHDLLHDIQKGCQEHLMRGAMCNDPEKVKWEDIEDAHMTLCEELEQREGVPSATGLPESDVGWLEKLRGAADEIEEAFTDEDIKRLKRGARKVSSLISTQLGKMNTRLNEKARNLRLGPLIEGLGEISAAVGDGGADADQSEQFRQGLGAMKRLEDKAARLVGEHDSWQAVEDEMRLIYNGVLRHELEELEMGWDDLKCQIQGLYETPDEDWVVRLEKCASQLDEALESGVENKMERYYLRYYRQASFRFVLVDKELKSLTQDMRTIGDKLSDVLAEITRQ